MLPEAGPAAATEPGVPGVPFRGDQDEGNDLNLPAHEDQQERVRVIARGNRDAILKARERMVLRRGGTERATVAASAEDEISDDGTATHHVTGARDNGAVADRFADDSLLPVADRFARRSQGHLSGLDSRTRGYADPTPPVPADEVNGRLWQSPQVTRSSDAARFESVPEIKPDLALPQLRTFLRVNEPGSDTQVQPGGQGGQDDTEQPETSYDRVLQRAQAIKSASQKERNSRLIRNRPRPQFPAPRLIASGAVESTPAHEHTAVPDRPVVVERRQDIDEESLESETPRFHVEDEWDAEPDDARTAASGTLDPYGDEDPLIDDDGYPLYDDDDDDFDEAAPSPRTGPQHSWWRGLNIGFRRRAEQHSLQMDGPNASDDDSDWLDDADPASEPWPADDDLADSEEPAASRGPERVFSFASGQGPDIRPSISLRDSRTAEEELIDYELTDEVLETSFADDTDRIQSEAWREERHAVSKNSGPVPTRTDRSRTESAFALSDPREMDAFRAMLFGTVSEGADARMQSHPDRQRSRRTPEPSPVPREDVPAARQERPDGDDRPVRAQHRYVEEVEFDIRDFVEQDEELLDMRVQIAPDIPRACQTCRNFRPSESGERGWCTNDFAFTHRQMVNADGLPCQSSIGCWWLPSDESWMPDVDTAFRDRPTPLTDRLIAHRHGRGLSEDNRESVLYVREM